MADVEEKKVRLKKDGTPDRRGGKIGNKGNKHATGRKHIEGQEIRKHIGFKATEKEYRLILEYAHILKTDYDKGIRLLQMAGEIPESRAKRYKKRENHVLRALEKEKEPIKSMLAIIKDRYTKVYNLISDNEQSTPSI
jgi:hypothetical protein